MSNHTIVVIWVMKIFLYSSLFSCHLFLVSSVFVRSMPFLSFIVPIFAWYIPLVSLIFLKGSRLSHSIVFLHFFAFIMEVGFLSLLPILWNLAFRWVYLSFSPLPFTSLLFPAICKASSGHNYSFLHFFFLGMVYLSLPLYNSKGSDLGHTWTV